MDMAVDTIPKFSKRLLTSAILVGTSLYAIFWAPNWIFVLTVELFVLLSLNEFFEMAAKKEEWTINRGLGLTFGGLFPLTYYFPGDVVIMLSAVLCIFLYNFHRRLKAQALVNTSVTMFGIVYVAWFFSFIAKIRQLPHGAWWVLFVILVTKSGDMAAYFVGQRYGRTKFIPHISPQKSVEGSVASFACSVGVASLSKVYLPYVPMVHLITLGIVLGVLAQVGDLCESLIKRDVGVKDSGNLPGIGGVLDVLDSLLFTIPFLYYYLVAFPGVGG